ncbi:hypothetical protein [Xanthomonas sp. MUS 060]|uniref:hypothetical protein n=1 Tax=Xanthomonas sp. MUS 060 TaxID=1588031 RepID=UPI000A658CB5|nr:hypothetical protein [Xanthomonas sp. MUS 060]
MSDDTVHVAVLVQAAQPVGTREVVLATANKPTLETVQNTHSKETTTARIRKSGVSALAVPAASLAAAGRPTRSTPRQ